MVAWCSHWSLRVVTKQPCAFAVHRVWSPNSHLRFTEQPFAVTEQPFAVTEQPFAVTEQPFVVTEQPFVVTEQPCAVTDHHVWSLITACSHWTAMWPHVVISVTTRGNQWPHMAFRWLHAMISDRTPWLVTTHGFSVTTRPDRWPHQATVNSILNLICVNCWFKWSWWGGRRAYRFAIPLSCAHHYIDEIQTTIPYLTTNSSLTWKWHWFKVVACVYHGVSCHGGGISNPNWILVPWCSAASTRTGSQPIAFVYWLQFYNLTRDFRG